MAGKNVVHEDGEKVKHEAAIYTCSYAVSQENSPLTPADLRQLHLLLEHIALHPGSRVVKGALAEVVKLQGLAQHVVTVKFHERVQLHEGRDAAHQRKLVSDIPQDG